MGLAKYELALNERKLYSISLPNSRISSHGSKTIVISAVEETPSFHLRNASDGGVILHLASIKFTAKTEVSLDLSGV
jgi:hypothetical protein